VKNAGHEPTLPGLKNPALDIGEAREVAVDEFLQRLFRGVIPPFDLGGRGAQGRGVLVAGLGLSGEGVAQERLTRDAVLGGAVRRQECLRLTRGESVAHDRTGKVQLGPASEGAEL